PPGAMLPVGCKGLLRGSAVNSKLNVVCDTTMLDCLQQFAQRHHFLAPHVIVSPSTSHTSRTKCESTPPCVFAQIPKCGLESLPEPRSKTDLRFRRVNATVKEVTSAMLPWCGNPEA